MYPPLTNGCNCSLSRAQRTEQDRLEIELLEKEETRNQGSS